MPRILHRLSFVLWLPTFTVAQPFSLPQVLIGEIHFDGNIVYSDQELRDSLLLSRQGSLYLKDKLEYDLNQHLLGKYRANGYIMAKVGEVNLDPVASENGATSGEIYNLIVPIEEGRQFHYGKLEMAGVTLFEPDQLLGLLDLCSEDIVDYPKMKAATELLRILYLREGYSDLDVRPDVKMNVEAGTIDLLLHIQEGEPKHSLP